MKKYFYKNLIELRTDKNISQLELSKLVDISQSAIARWELNISQPKVDDIIKLSKFFNISADNLLGIDDEFGEDV